MEERCRKFYIHRYSDIVIPKPNIYAAMQQVFRALVSELWSVTFQLKSERAPGNDSINVELSKAGGQYFEGFCPVKPVFGWRITPSNQKKRILEFDHPSCQKPRPTEGIWRALSPPPTHPWTCIYPSSRSRKTGEQKWSFSHDFPIGPLPPKILRILFELGMSLLLSCPLPPMTGGIRKGYGGHPQNALAGVENC